MIIYNEFKQKTLLHATFIKIFKSDDIIMSVIKYALFHSKLFLLPEQRIITVAQYAQLGYQLVVYVKQYFNLQ